MGMGLLCVLITNLCIIMFFYRKNLFYFQYIIVGEEIEAQSLNLVKYSILLDACLSARTLQSKITGQSVKMMLCLKQAVLWREDWAVFCLVGLVHWHALPSCLHWIVCLFVWRHYSGSLPSQVWGALGELLFASI